MQLQKLIKYLEAEPVNRAVPFGFGYAHSYRGNYSELAFIPKENVPIGEMLAEAREAVGATFSGYKGGDYTMGPFTECYLANYGECGETLGPALLAFMLGRNPCEFVSIRG